MEKVREVAIRLLDEVEEVLGNNNIMVPDNDREGNEEEASLYGATYYNLEDTFVRILKEELKMEGGEEE